MPCESNFSGERYDPNIVASVQQHGPWGRIHPVECSANHSEIRPSAGHHSFCNQPCHHAVLEADGSTEAQSCSDSAQLEQTAHRLPGADDLDSHGIECPDQQPHALSTSSQQPIKESCSCHPAANVEDGRSTQQRAAQDTHAELPDGQGRQQQQQQQKWYVLLDAAKACASQPPDLSNCPADFVVGVILQFPSPSLHGLPHYGILQHF